MFAEETVVVVPSEGEGEGEGTADVEAARAQASAQAAAEAAATATVMADVQAAQVADNAAVQLAGYQERLEECRAQLADVIQSQGAYAAEAAELRTQMATLAESHSLILSRLPPENPTNQEPAPTEPEAGADPAPPAEPSPPEKRRAHRWI